MTARRSLLAAKLLNTSQLRIRSALARCQVTTRRSACLQSASIMERQLTKSATTAATPTAAAKVTIPSGALRSAASRQVRLDGIYVGCSNGSWLLFSEDEVRMHGNPVSRPYTVANGVLTIVQQRGEQPAEDPTIAAYLGRGYNILRRPRSSNITSTPARVVSKWTLHRRNKLSLKSLPFLSHRTAAPWCTLQLQTALSLVCHFL